MNDFGLTSEEIERIDAFSKLTIEEKIRWLDDTYKFVMETMGVEGRKAFYYLRHKDEYSI